jgi:predicted ATPase
LASCDPCQERLRGAVSLYSGEFLEGFSLPDSPAFEEWSLLEGERLHRLALEALHHLTQGQQTPDKAREALQYARRQVELDPWQERGHRQLMRLLALSGQRGSALAQYQICRRILREELGVEPEAATTQLYQRIRDETRADPRTAAPAHNLPAAVTPFIGRKTELKSIAAHLDDPDCRLLTLLGPGGIGKTRLALEFALSQLDNFGDGVFFVPLAPLQRAVAIPSAVATALDFGFYEDDDPQKQLYGYMRHKRILLILDNFEHLLDGGDLVVALLEEAPNVKIVVTSRARLNLQAEQILSVTGMGLSADEEAATDSDSVRLFLSTAQRVRPGYEPTRDDLLAILQICRFVGGIPLGILLTAAWMRLLTPGEIAAQVIDRALDRYPLNDPNLDFFQAEMRDLPPRQRSLRDVFEHSWKLLSGRQRRVFQALAVFRGGFTWQAAAEIADASLRELLALVDQSLILRTPTGRFEIHELLRVYASEQLGRSSEATTVRDRHCTFFSAALATWARALKGPGQLAALAEMEMESENALWAWSQAVARRDTTRLAQGLEGLCLFCEWRVRYREGAALCRDAAEVLRDPSPSTGALTVHRLKLLIVVWAWESFFNRRLVRTERAQQLLGQCLALLEEPVLAGQDTRGARALVLYQLGQLAVDADRQQAQWLYEQSLELYGDLNDRWAMAQLLSALGGVAWNLGQYKEAKSLHAASLRLRKEIGDRRGIANALSAVGFTALQQGHLDEAQQRIEESVALREEMGDRVGIADGLRNLAMTWASLGQFARARDLMQKCLAIYTELGFRFSLEVAMLAAAELHLGSFQAAGQRARAALEIAQETGFPRGRGYALLILAEVAMAEGTFSRAHTLLRECIPLYREIGQREKLSHAFADLGFAASGMDNRPVATGYLYEGLRTAADVQAFIPLLTTLAGIALLLAERGEPVDQRKAADLYTMLSTHPYVANSRWFHQMVGRHIVAIAGPLSLNGRSVDYNPGDVRELQRRARELLADLEQGLFESTGGP